jgi:hypothetical protein
MAFLPGEEDARLMGVHPASAELVTMTPDEYLGLTGVPLWLREQGVGGWDSDPDYVKLTERIREGKPVDALWLDVDVDTGKVTGQEGRHRALIAKQLGIEHVPVILFHRDDRGDFVNIRPDPYQRVGRYESVHPKRYARLVPRGY